MLPSPCPYLLPFFTSQLHARAILHFSVLPHTLITAIPHLRASPPHICCLHCSLLVPPYSLPSLSSRPLLFALVTKLSFIPTSYFRTPCSLNVCIPAPCNLLVFVFFNSPFLIRDHLFPPLRTTSQRLPTFSLSIIVAFQTSFFRRASIPSSALASR